MPGLGGYTGVQIGRFALVLVLGAGLVVLLPTKRRIASGGLIALLAIDLLLFVGRFTPATRAEYVHVESQTVDLIRADPEPARVLSLGRDPVRRMAPNTAMIVGLEDIQGSDSLEVGTYRQLLGTLCSDGLGFPQPDPCLPAVGLLGAKYVLSGVDPGDVPGLSLISSAEGLVYRNERALPRAFIATGYAATPDEQAVLATIRTPHFAPETALFAGKGPIRELVVPHPRPRLPVTYASPQRAAVSGDFVPGELVVLTDTYYPGWRAFQDGREVPVLRVDYALRAVQIEEPSQRIDFVYLPASFRLGAFGTLCGLGLLAGVGMAVVAGRRRGPQ
jgi:hypothetical protein